MPGLGASSLHNLLRTCNWNDDEVHLQLATKLSNQKNAQIKDADAVLCIANSLFYECTTSKLGYMYQAPVMIEEYNKAFAATETLMINGPAVLKCKRCSGGCHFFLEAE